MAKKNKRFEVIESENLGLASLVNILVDKETGVNYVFYQQGYSGGLTPLLDNKGNPVITEIKK